MAVDRLERLVNLVAALLDTPRPLTREDVRQRIEGYSDDPDAFRRNFERDKEVLRELGLPLVTEPLDPGHPDQIGYRIPREQYELPDPGLDDSELAALRLAASAIQVEGNRGRSATTRALRKLGGGAEEAVGTHGSTARRGSSGAASARPSPTSIAELPANDVVAGAFAAIAERRLVRFTYRGLERTVEPWGLSFRRGQWYLSGLDRSRGEERLFRLDRVDGELRAEGPPEAFERPDQASAGPPPAWQLGDEETVTAEVLVDADQARWAIAALGVEAVHERRQDGSVVVRMDVTNTAAFRSFVLGFLDHAEVLAPPELRTAVREWLASIASDRPGA